MSIRCDAQGIEHNFLADYYRTTQELASNIFRKGYQWPFHATRMLDFGSSLVDLAITRENQAGRRVFMDVNRNPLTVPGDLPFSLDRLDGDVRCLPRLCRRGPGAADRQAAAHEPAVDRALPAATRSISRSEPLEFAVNDQHMNGGVAVDIWGRSSASLSLHAVGEAAGTHGVMRPGGAALNAGEVFGTRAAEHVAARRVAASEAVSLPAIIAGAVADVLSVLNAGESIVARVSSGARCRPG